MPKISSVVAAHQEQIDELIAANSKHWRLERMPAVDRNLLRMAVGEMLGFKATPFPIVINEALEIARRYSAPESINFLNGMLDSIARSLLAEVSPRSRSPLHRSQSAGSEGLQLIRIQRRPMRREPERLMPLLFGDPLFWCAGRQTQILRIVIFAA